MRRRKGSQCFFPPKKNPKPQAAGRHLGAAGLKVELDTTAHRQSRRGRVFILLSLKLARLAREPDLSRGRCTFPVRPTVADRLRRRFDALICAGGTATPTSCGSPNHP